LTNCADISGPLFSPMSSLAGCLQVWRNIPAPLTHRNLAIHNSPLPDPRPSICHHPKAWRQCTGGSTTKPFRQHSGYSCRWTGIGARLQTIWYLWSVSFDRYTTGSSPTYAKRDCPGCQGRRGDVEGTVRLIFFFFFFFLAPHHGMGRGHDCCIFIYIAVNFVNSLL